MYHYIFIRLLRAAFAAKCFGSSFICVREMQFEMMEPKLCQITCKIVLTEQGANDIKEKIEDEYRVNM